MNKHKRKQIAMIKEFNKFRDLNLTNTERAYLDTFLDLANEEEADLSPFRRARMVIWRELCLGKEIFISHGYENIESNINLISLQYGTERIFKYLPKNLRTSNYPDEGRYPC